VSRKRIKDCDCILESGNELEPHASTGLKDTEWPKSTQMIQVRLVQQVVDGDHRLEHKSTQRNPAAERRIPHGIAGCLHLQGTDPVLFCDKGWPEPQANVLQPADFFTGQRCFESPPDGRGLRQWIIGIQIL